MEFNPNNNIVKLCIQGMEMEDSDRKEEAIGFFMQAWKEATSDFEKFLAAHFIARSQKDSQDKLDWLLAALEFALKIDDISAKSALPSLYSNIAKCYEDLNDFEQAKKNNTLGIESNNQVFDNGPFYHGTRADLQLGDLLTAGCKSNYKSEITMNHIYFTALVNGAGLAAALASGEGNEHVYIVEPMGSFENDPNVTDKKFPGNPTRSYRTQAQLKIVGEVKDWTRITPEELKNWRQRLAKTKGEIIN